MGDWLRPDDEESTYVRAARSWRQSAATTREILRAARR
jgi:plasmid stability protein